MNTKHLLLGFLLISSSILVAKPLQFVYYDQPAAAAQGLAELSEEQVSFFAQYEYAVQQVNKGADISDYFIVETATNASDAVSPLLGDIMYDQGTPYNDLCPMINGRRAVTGCVATAMAQIMRYYAYPTAGHGVVTYTGSNGATQLNLADYTFNWNLIRNNYKASYTSAEGEAVAKLMLACGAALNMNYSADGSGSQISKARLALRDNFGYTSKMEYYDSANDYDPEGLIEYDWVYTIRDNHQKGYPVMYAGSPASGMAGHAFVIDGYKVIDGVYYYHVNWGWSGSQNGYYLIMNLNPSGEENYSGYGCDMVVNIYYDGWTDVENVEQGENKFDLNAPVYNILGQPVSAEHLQRGNIYIQKGRKFMY